MKMTALEKHFVNGLSHTRTVAGRARQMLERIGHQAGWRYLDVGCGTGAAACAIAGDGRLEVTGVDVDPQQVAAANDTAGRANLRFRVMDATALDFRDGEFDIVATSMTTHHIPDWERALSEMVRVLRPGGYLIYSDHVFPAWLARAARRFICFLGFPSAGALDALAAQAGLSKVYEARQSRRVDAIWLKTA
jgi:ubiquinone/menaquinone biosynthesis C-methylase UbiE